MQFRRRVFTAFSSLMPPLFLVALPQVREVYRGRRYVLRWLLLQYADWVSHPSSSLVSVLSAEAPPFCTAGTPCGGRQEERGERG